MKSKNWDMIYLILIVPFIKIYAFHLNLPMELMFYSLIEYLIIIITNCKPSNYSIESQYLKCDCDTSNSEIITRDIDKFTPKIIYQGFKDTLKFSNYKVLLCYKLPFRIDSITTNIGSIIIIILFIIYIIFLIIFCYKGIAQFKSFFKDEINNNNDIKPIKWTNEKLNIKNRIRNDNKLNSHRSSSRKSLKRNYKSMNLFQYPPKKELISYQNEYYKNENLIKKTRNNHLLKLNDNDSKTKKILSPEQNSVMNNGTEKVPEKVINNSDNLEDIKKEDNVEIYNFENKEKETMNKDKKSFFEIYLSILRKKHIILFTFFTRNDYNIIYMKLERFIFSVSTYMALNIFFFEDETMHKIYLDYGKYLILTERHYYEIKKLKLSNKDKIVSIIKCIKIKITTFFIFTFLLFMFYWYSIACFCSVYENTQVIFIKDSISSFGFGLLYPFILYIILAAYKLITLNKK